MDVEEAGEPGGRTGPGTRPSGGPPPVDAGSAERVAAGRQETTEPTAHHATTTVEQGAFTYARCRCGWRGPARRARDRARADASDHLPGAR